MNHLTEDQLDDILIGDGSETAKLHLAGCDHCRTQLATFESALGDFNQATLAWAEAKSNTISRDVLAGAPKRPLLEHAAGWSLGLVTALVLAVSVALHHPAAPPSPAVAQVVPSGEQVRQQEIAQDNAMLANIDSALYAPVASPDAIYASKR